MKEYQVIDLLDSVISGEWGNEPSGKQDGQQISPIMEG